MKKRIVTVLLAFVLCFGFVCGDELTVNAEGLGEDLDFSYLLTEETLVGHMQMQTKGVYLASGDSFINKMAVNTIGAGGITSAAVKCKVSVTSIVERKTDTGWARVTSWTQTNASAFSATVSKSLTVGVGYYYRVRSSHYASSDYSSSNTSALWMGYN